MSFVFSDRANAFGPNIFNILDDEKKKVLAEGRKVYNLSIGTPDFKPSSWVMEAVSEAAKNPEKYKYSMGDTAELKEAVKNWYARRYGVQLEDGEIMTVLGTQEGMSRVALTVCNPGDIVFVPNPGYPIFEVGPFLCGADVRYYDLLPENNYVPDLSLIPEDVLDKTKMFVVSSPLNPTCTTLPVSFYEELIRFAQKHNILIVNDNAYSEIMYDANKSFSVLSLEGAKDVAVEFNSLSKSYDLTGLRISFLLGNKEVVEKFNALRSQLDYGMSHLSQIAAITALNGPQECVEEQRAEYERRRNTLCDGLAKLGFGVKRSEGTMFVWAKIPEGHGGSEDFCVEMIKKCGVVCTPGTAFGTLGEGYVRFALVLPCDKLEEALAAMRSL